MADASASRRCIYALVSRDRQICFVGATKEANAYQAYKDHAHGKYVATREWFTAAGEALPQMYRLEAGEMTREEAKERCLAWAMYFRHHGYRCLASKSFLAAMDDPGAAAATLYEALCHRPDVLTAGTCLVDIYRLGSLIHGKEPIPSSITYSVSPAQYERIQASAKQMAKSVPAYCREMALDGVIYRYHPCWSIYRLFRDAVRMAPVAAKASRNILRILPPAEGVTPVWMPDGYAETVETLCRSLDKACEAYARTVRDIAYKQGRMRPEYRKEN